MGKPRRVHDRALLDALGIHDARAYSRTAWRTTFRSRGPLLGNTAGGRWHPPNSFEVLYTSCEADGSLAEVYHHLSMAPVFSSADMVLAELRIELERVLYLTGETELAALGVEDPRAHRSDLSLTQAIGAAARFLEYQALIVPSARWRCNNVIIFLDQLDLNESITIVDEQPVTWPAWRERQADASM